MKLLRTIGLFLALAAPPVLATAQPQVGHRADAQVEYSTRAPDRFAFTTSRGDRLQLILERHERLESEFAPHAPTLRDGQDRYFRGRIEERDGSWARLARIDGAWIGAVDDGTTVWLLDPAVWHGESARSPGTSTAATIVFDMADVHLPAGFDAGHADEHLPSGADLLPHPGAEVARGSERGIDRYLRVTLVLDREFQTRYGANAAAVAGAVLNVADGFYRAQVGLDLSLLHLHALASNGAMTSTNPNQLLEAFVAYLNTGTVPRGGVSHLLSGKDFDGNTVGLAYLGTACRTDGFASGIDQITFSQAFGGATLAHEIGHNLDAQHDSQGNACPVSGFIMAAVININNPATQFSSCSLDYFQNFFQSRPLPCLAAPPDLIFANGFQR